MYYQNNVQQPMGMVGGMGMNPYGTPMGTQYLPRPQARNTQPLSNEIINKLRSVSNANYQVTQEQIWRAQCTHKDKNGASTLVQDRETGKMHCDICGHEFNFFDGDTAEVTKRVNDMFDVMNTIKTIFLDMPEPLAAAYFQFEPLMLMLPQLWTEANKNFSRYDQIPMTAQATGYTTNNFGILGQMTGNPAYGMYNPGMMAPYQMQGMAPNMGQPMQGMAPNMGQPMQGMAPNMGQPMQAPMYQQAPQQMQGGNAFVAPMPGNIPMPNQQMGQPQMMYQQNPQQVPVVPQTNVAPQTQEAPTANGEVVQQQSFKV